VSGVFFDTNVVIYLLSADTRKANVAEALYSFVA
jgi:predicted nucleic acid-binding protein